MKEINELSYTIRGAIYLVHNKLGPGLFEHVYEAALNYELSKLGLIVETQVPLPLIYEGVHLEIGFRIDMLIESKIIIEIKSVETLHNIHKKQLLTYLRLSGIRFGILVNFNDVMLMDKVSLIRIIN